MRRIILTFVIALLASSWSFATIAEAHVLPVGRRYPTAVESYRPYVKRFFPKDRLGQVDRGLQQRALAVLLDESGGSVNSRPQVGPWQFAMCHLTGHVYCDYHHVTHYGRAMAKCPVMSTRMAARLYVNQGYRFQAAWVVARRLGIR